MNPDELVRRYILNQYRENQPMTHLAMCQGTIVDQAETRGALFYDTGVDGTIFTAVLRCPHVTEDYEYGEIGELPDILDYMQRQDRS